MVLKFVLKKKYTQKMIWNQCVLRS